MNERERLVSRLNELCKNPDPGQFAAETIESLRSSYAILTAAARRLRPTRFYENRFNPVEWLDE